MNDLEKIIAVPRELAERLYERLSDTQDEGPPGLGWRSRELTEDINAMAELLGLPAFDKR